MVIRLSYAMVCVEQSCQVVFNALDYPSCRCPLCGSEAVNLAMAEQVRAKHERDRKERAA